jgi:hypothetical protein
VLNPILVHDLRRTALATLAIPAHVEHAINRTETKGMPSEQTMTNEWIEKFVQFAIDQPKNIGANWRFR